MFISRRRIILPLTIALFLAGTHPAGAINYINNCEGQSTSAPGKWFATCPPYDNSQNNWEGNTLPGPTDVAVLPLEFGEVLIDGYASEAVVLSVSAMGGLRTSASSNGLTLTSGASVINGLQLSPGTINAGAGVTVSLLGNSVLSGRLNGPGVFENSGTMSLNGCLLRGGAVMVNTSAATLTSGIIQLGDDNTILINAGGLEISQSAVDIRGGGSLLANNGSLTVNRPGATFPISPNYEQRGDLLVEAGTLHFYSNDIDFISGAVTINTEAVLVFGGAQSGSVRRFSGPITISGGGVVDDGAVFDVEDELTLAVGSGDPQSGAGGYLHRGTLNLAADVTNTGRFRFASGTLEFVSQAGYFTNAQSGWVYTRSSGNGTVNTGFWNDGNFQLGGGSITVNRDFFNSGVVHILGGNISGSGIFINHGLIEVSLSNPAAITTISVSEFESAVDGRTHTIAGNLRFTGSMDLVDGTLSRGRYYADPGTTIRFPETVTKITGSAGVFGDKSSFPNVELAEIVGSASMGTGGWETLSDILIEDGELNVEAGGTGMKVNGKLTNGSGGNVKIAPDAQLEADQIDNGEDGFESVIPELAPIVSVAKVSTPPLIITPLLNNHGRIVPGGADRIGSMQLIGNLVQHPAGELDIDVGPDVGEGQQDHFAITGNATLGGSITVDLMPGFWPVPGQEFPIVSASGLLDGVFAGINQPLGATFSLRYEANQVVLVTDEVSGPADVPSGVTAFGLAAAYPNPFNPVTTIGFDLPRELAIDLQVFDVAGRLVRALIQGRTYRAGTAEVSWDGRDDDGALVPAGMYFYRIQAEEFSATRRMTLVK